MGFINVDHYLLLYLHGVLDFFQKFQDALVEALLVSTHDDDI